MCLVAMRDEVKSRERSISSMATLTSSGEKDYQVNTPQKAYQESLAFAHGLTHKSRPCLMSCFRD